MSEHEGLQARLNCELGKLVARGAAQGALVAASEAVLGCRLLVLTDEHPASQQMLVSPIAPGTEVLGWLQSDIPAALATAELTDCLEFGARVIGVELVRERAALAMRWSLEADLLTELIAAGGDISERLKQRARHADLDLNRRWFVLLLEVDGRPASDELKAAARRPAVSGERSTSCLLGERLAVAVCEEPRDARDAKLRDLHRVARGLGMAMCVGVSSAVVDFARGVRQAEAALRLATCSPQTSTMFHDDLGSLRFLLDAPNQVELMALVQTHIGPLAERDRERHSDLLETLRVYLDEGGNRRRAAERCHVHQSTIKYRLRHIRELLGCDLADADVRFDLMLALKVLGLLRAVDADPMAGGVLQPS